MSEMIANKGIIRELYPDVENVKDKLEYLAKDLGVEMDKLATAYDNDYIGFNTPYYKDYSIISNRLFDYSDARDTYDVENNREFIKRISPTELEVDLYYYNGGTCMEEFVAKFLANEPKQANSSVEEKLLQKILYIGDEIPFSIIGDKRPKFIVLGTPQEFINAVNE